MIGPKSTAIWPSARLLRGIWEVEEFEVAGQIRPLLVTDSARWRRVIFDYPGVIAVQQMSDSRSRYTLVLDTEKKTLDLGKRDDPEVESGADLRTARAGAAHTDRPTGRRADPR